MLKSVFTFREILRFRSGWMNKLEENIAKNRKYQERVRKQRDFERVALERLKTYRMLITKNMPNIKNTAES